jgi:hypothetical protein
VPDPPPEPTPATPAESDLRAALERARRGDRSALAGLRAALDAHPEIWEQYGDLAAHAHRSWVELIAGTDLALAEALARKAAALEAELAGPVPSPLERLLAGRVVACWLQVHHADATLAQAGEVSIKQADLAQKRQARAHKGYLMAIAALATVRRLLPAAPARDGAPAKIPASPDGDSPDPGPRQPGHAGPVAAAAEAGDGDRLGGPAGPAPLALFDRLDDPSS